MQHAQHAHRKKLFLGDELAVLVACHCGETRSMAPSHHHDSCVYVRSKGWPPTALYLRVPRRITRNYWKMRVLEIPHFFVGQQRRCTMGNIVVWHQWILSAVHLQHILRSRRGFTDHWNLRLSRSQNSKATAPLPKPHVWTGVTYLTGNHSRSTERLTIGLRKDMERRRGDTETMVFFGQSPSSLPSKVKAQRKTVGFRPFKGLSR